MTSIDKTLEFRESVQSRAKLYPPRKPRAKAEDLWTKQAEQVVRELDSTL